jgi:hypothetical protein
MSIHAHLNQEAQARLAAQRRNSTITSIVISMLVMLLIFLVLGIFFIPNVFKDSPTIVTYAGSLTEDNKIQEKKVSSNIQRKPSAPANSMSKVIASKAPSPTSIPVPDINVVTPSADFGDGEDFGSGWGGAGDGFGDGGNFSGVPSTMQKRCSKADRLARLKEMGGTPECEDAVVKALDWLQKTQKPDGSWTSSHPVSMTGLALLAYLGHCETPQSEKYGDTVLRAMTYLINVGLKNDGRLTDKDLNSIPWVYEHGICTYALAEAYTFCSSMDIEVPDLDKVTKEALNMIIGGQGASGGWVYRYESTNGGDNSVGFWQIQALKAGMHTGLLGEAKFKKPSRKAIEFLESVQGANGAIGYRNNPAQSPGLTGGALLCMQLFGEGKSSSARKALKYLEDNSSFEWGGAKGDLYYQYYNAQAMMNQGGKAWDTYNEDFRDDLLKAQNAEGWWSSGVTHHRGGMGGDTIKHFDTCLSTLMLEVYYRFLPGTGGK